ncbi:ABC transporter substrate-binding protein [Phormidium willei BDU 130791]|nr:ABC transporter substrate-binding protein [Phormidium willei BDU 130791]
MSILDRPTLLNLPRRWGRPLWAIATSVTVVGLSSCAADPDRTSATPQGESDSEELQVVTSFLPMTQFTKAVVGDRAEVTQLLPLGVDPHDYQARPAEVQTLAEADILVKNGLGMEFYLDGLIANAENPDLLIIDTSEGIAVLSSQHSKGHEHDHDEHDHDEHDHDEHDHDEHDHDEHDHDDNHAHEHDHGHHHGEYNPHIWIDPKRAIQQVENIRDGLITHDPEGEAEYTANAAAYIEQLRDLDADISNALEPYAGETFIVFHDFAPYFAESYNLESDFLVDIPESNPSPGDVQRISEQVANTNLKTLLAEPQAGQEAFSALAQDLDINVSIFSPVAVAFSPEDMEPEAYLTIMRENLANLQSAFAGSAQSWWELETPELAHVSH